MACIAVNLCTATTYVLATTALPYFITESSVFISLHMRMYDMNDSNADSLFTRMTSDTFLYTTSWFHSIPGAGKQAGVLSGSEKAQCALMELECHSKLLSSFLLL